MRLFLLFILAAFASAFTAVTPTTIRTTATTRLSLHPDQAKELEQCAIAAMMSDHSEITMKKKKVAGTRFEWAKKMFVHKQDGVKISTSANMQH